MVGVNRSPVTAKRGGKKKGAPGRKQDKPTKRSAPTPPTSSSPSVHPAATPSPFPAPSMSPSGTPDPCQDQIDAYDAAVRAQRDTQAALNKINSRQKEREVMASNDPQRIKQWKADVAAATKANNDAADKVTATQKAKDECPSKHGQPQKARAGWLPM